MNPIYKFHINRDTVNLLDPSAMRDGFALNASTGAVSALAGSQVSDYMPVEPGVEYGLKNSQNIEMDFVAVAFYDSEYTFISGAASVRVAEAPAGAAFALISLPSSYDAAEWQFADATLNYSAYVSPRVFPTYGNNTAMSFEKEGGQEFFRRKLSGQLKFTGPDYAYIVAQAFDHEFKMQMQISYDRGQTWTPYWNGKFYKTDCKFNDDDKAVTVTPTTDDDYNAVIAGLEKEYDLIKLAPEIVPVKYDKRPMLQFYVPGTSVIACYLSGMWWEQECEPTNEAARLFNDCKFFLSKDMTVAELTQTGTPTIPRSMFVASPQGHWDDGYTLSAQDYELVVAPLGGSSFSYTIRDTINHTALWYGTRVGSPTPNFSLQLAAVTGSGATGTVDVNISLWQIFTRLVTDKATAETTEFSANDIILDKRNYRYVVPVDCGDAILFNSYFASNPTEWGLYEPGYYYSRPNARSFPIGRKWWGAFSIWLNAAAVPESLDVDNRQPETLRDAYPIASVISVLLGQFAPGITHQGTTDYSRFLYGDSDPLTFVPHHLFITPKSNILASGYDQPAQTAKITLRSVLDMLRDCFRCYWFIDDQKRFRIEHIEFFRRGGSYSLLPSVGIDLTQEIVTRNGKPWAYARNQYQFEKPAMAARYQFGWMDDVTQEFEGQPIDIISGYVEPGNIENITVNQFTTDVDYMLLNPGACSKDGFALLSAVLKLNARDIDFEQGMLRVFVGEPFESCKQSSSKQIRTANLIPIVNSSIFVQSFGTGLNYAIHEYDSSKCLLRSSGAKTGDNTITFLDATRYIAIVVLRANNTDISPDIVSTFTNTISGIGPWVLPYERFEDSRLQNGQLCWPYLQIYYVWDMPARNYKIGIHQYTATGVKKLKTQPITFPCYTDPDMQKLVTTLIGNGMLEKLSLNLCSRFADATLRYDTE